MRQVGTSVLLAVYLFAFVFLPVQHIHTLHSEPAKCCTHHEQDNNDNDTLADDCFICDVLHSASPLYQFSEPLITQTEGSPCVLPLLVSFPVAEAAVLPPCRAPPIV